MKLSSHPAKFIKFYNKKGLAINEKICYNQEDLYKSNPSMTCHNVENEMLESILH